MTGADPVKHAPPGCVECDTVVTPEIVIAVA